jgi:hypothetical protein
MRPPLHKSLSLELCALPSEAGQGNHQVRLRSRQALASAPTPNAMAKFNAAGMRVDGKTVSDLVKKELAGK